MRMSLSLREFRPRCDEVRRNAPLFNHRALRDTFILHSPFSILNYCYISLFSSANTVTPLFLLSCINSLKTPEMSFRHLAQSFARMVRW